MPSCDVDGSDWGIEAVGAFLAKPFIDYVDFVGDVDFMQHRAYPFIKAVGDFYQSYTTLVNGSYHILYSCAQEGCSQAGSESGSVVKSNDPPYDLAFFKRIFRTLIEWSQRLKV
jgi:hypothetical protein